jgi:radical SAM superfamily enzyme YgiQ (UPF0313 family)
MGEKRVLLGASWSAIENLGIMHIGGLARDMGWHPSYSLVKEHNFDDFHNRVREEKPEIVGFNVYTGNHVQALEAFRKIKSDFPDVRTVFGGPYATYEPVRASQTIDFIVMSEGFEPFKRILLNEAQPGILPMEKTRRIPLPDRNGFYADNPEFSKSPIKSAIGTTGCPYKCKYCYNSSRPIDLELPAVMFEALKMQFSGRLFPRQERSVEDLVTEVTELLELSPDTKMIYWQDDVFGQNLSWLEEFAESISRLNIRGHGQMRWEMADPSKEGSLRRLDDTRRAGLDGLTFAIEAEDPNIREEVLDRKMTNEVMFEGMRELKKIGFTIRTEQILALPYGRTSVPTPINLDADLKVLELNVNLREQTGGPDIAWASTYAPYIGTRLGKYSKDYGFYSGDNDDLDDTFFDISKQRFLAQWVGPEGHALWLPESEQQRYRLQNKELRTHFNFFARTPKGHILARSYLTRDEPFSYERLGRETMAHLKTLSDEGNLEAASILKKIDSVKRAVSQYAEDSQRSTLMGLAPYFAVLPKSEIAVKRAVRYGHDAASKGGLENTSVFSRAIRHHLYEEVLYDVGSNFSRPQTEERYIPKI